MTEPAHRIAYIPEVLETILVHTDTHTLLTSAQRVCRYWYDLVQNSDDLQIALFLSQPKNLIT